MNPYIRKNGAFVFMLVLYTCYAALFIYNGSFVVYGERYFTLFEDMMISMRYAKNWVAGYGIVFNPGGERIEGYTNMLYMFFMALVHLLPVAASKISLIIEVFCAGCMIANLVAIRKIAHEVFDGSEAIALGAVALTAMFLPLNFWTLYGGEVAPLTLLTSGLVLMTLRRIKSDASLLPVFLAAGAGTLIRIDFAVVLLTLAGFAFFARPGRRLADLIGAVASLIFFIGAQTIFRYAYFGEFLPNTYYLKMTGYPVVFRMAHGLEVFIDFVKRASAFLLILPVLVLVFRRDKNVLLLFTVVAAHVAYSIYIGGDAWEMSVICNRFISPAMPLYFILLSAMLYEIYKYVVDVAQKRIFTVFDIWGGIINLFKGKPAPPPSEKSTGNATKTKLGQYALKSIFALLILAAAADLNRYLSFNVIFTKNFLTYNESLVEQAIILDKITTSYATIATPEAGIMPYFLDRTVIDMTGKNDKKIARMPIALPQGLAKVTDFRAGHMKFDADYSIGELKPDIVAKSWIPDEKKTRPILDVYYTRVSFKSGEFTLDMYLRKDSKYVLWDKADELSRKSFEGVVIEK